MLQLAVLVELILGYIAFSLAFIQPRRQARGHKKAVRAPASRWGIGLQTVGFAFAWAYVRPAGYTKSAAALIASMILMPLSVALAWSAARNLGKQWRYEAALSEDHELVRTGPYRWIRHPIYTSILGMTLATLAGWTWWPMAVASLVFNLAGAEVRIRAEERLLVARFGRVYAEYKRTTHAFIPFVR